MIESEYERLKQSVVRGINILASRGALRSDGRYVNRSNPGEGFFDFLRQKRGIVEEFPADLSYEFHLSCNFPGSPETYNHLYLGQERQVGVGRAGTHIFILEQNGDDQTVPFILFARDIPRERPWIDLGRRPLPGDLWREAELADLQEAKDYLDFLTNNNIASTV